jgi:hypothetical protein
MQELLNQAGSVIKFISIHVTEVAREKPRARVVGARIPSALLLGSSIAKPHKDRNIKYVVRRTQRPLCSL